MPSHNPALQPSRPRSLLLAVAVLMVAAGYLGSTCTWHAGLSGSAPLLMATPKNFMEAQVGLIPVSMTTFSSFNLTLTAVVVTVMTLAVLRDRGGSMTGAFDDGHVETALGAIQSYVGAAGAGFDLVLYDDEAQDAGHIANWSDLQTALGQHRPRGRGGPGAEASARAGHRPECRARGALAATRFRRGTRRPGCER